jgi:hypothetical protein
MLFERGSTRTLGMFPIHQICDQVLNEWLPELAAHTGRSEQALRESGLSALDFEPGALRIELMDRSFVEFQYAFHVLSERHKAIAVFTEHCGYHAFPYHEAKVFRDGQLLYAQEPA